MPIILDYNTFQVFKGFLSKCFISSAESYFSCVQLIKVLSSLFCTF